MRIRKILCLIIILVGSTVCCFADTASPELMQELNVIKKELNKTGELTGRSTDLLLQQVNDLTQQLETAKSRISTLEKQLKTKNMENNSNKNVNYSRQSIFTSDNYADNVTNGTYEDYKRQLDKSSSIIVEQTRQLSKAYSEIERLKKAYMSTDKLLDNIIYQAEKFKSQGRTQDAVAVYEILDRLDIKKPQIYQNSALIYQKMGKNSEANKQYDKLYLFFPNLKDSAQDVKNVIK